MTVVMLPVPAWLKPLRTTVCTIEELRPEQREALEEAIDRDLIDTDGPEVLIETYRTSVIRRVAKELWRWPTTRREVRDWTFDPAEDLERINRIIDLLRSGDPQWPYVSLWTTSRNELFCQIEDDEHDRTLVNHGDGFHRILAAIACKRPTIDFLYRFRRDDPEYRGWKPSYQE